MPHETPSGDSARDLTVRLTESVRCREDGRQPLDRFHIWLRDAAQRLGATATPVPLERLGGWTIHHETGDISHQSGGFFSVGGIEVHTQHGNVPHWTQPIINQPEVGVLGLLLRRFNGIPHLLMQLKPEPGNHNGIQLAPTVQATRSNYTRVHGGKYTPYLDHFRDRTCSRILVDVRQSEQGAWFQRKRNRNMVVETTEDVPLQDGFCWLTLGQLHELLAINNLVNMDTRTVLSCLPLPQRYSSSVHDTPDSDFARALLWSGSPDAPSAHSYPDLLHWITDSRTRLDIAVAAVPIVELEHWGFRDGVLTHRDGLFFDVIGVEVQARGREVMSWAQPMIRPVDIGVIALLVTRKHGVLHALLRTRIEPGYVDVVELAPSVQCTPRNYRLLPAEAQPPLLETVLEARPDQVRFDTMLSEEGGRFYQARNRYLIVEVEPDTVPETTESRWLTTYQIGQLLRHSFYVNVQARSLIACLHSLRDRASTAEHDRGPLPASRPEACS